MPTSRGPWGRRYCAFCYLHDHPFDTSFHRWQRRPEVGDWPELLASQRGIHMRKSHLVVVVASVTLLSAGSLSPARGTAFTVAPLTLISGPSPFAGCTVGATGEPGETLYANAEEEPWVSVNPTNPSNIVAVWQQDRWSNGAARGLVTGVSNNGGISWTRTFPHFSICAGGTPANGGDFERS